MSKEEKFQNKIWNIIEDNDCETASIIITEFFEEEIKKYESLLYKENKFLSVESQVELQDFRDVENQYFDENGNAYKHSMSTDFVEQMKNLINKLEDDILSIVKKVNIALNPKKPNRR